MCSLMMISDMLSKHVAAVKSVLKKWFKINDIQLVHLLVVWYLVKLQDARCNNKDISVCFLPDISSNHHVKNSQQFIFWNHIITIQVVHLECNWKSKQLLWHHCWVICIQTTAEFSCITTHHSAMYSCFHYGQQCTCTSNTEFTSQLLGLFSSLSCKKCSVRCPRVKKIKWEVIQMLM